MSKFLISRVLSAVLAAGAALHLSLPVAMGDGPLAQLRGGSMNCCVVCAVNIRGCTEACGGGPLEYVEVEHEFAAWGSYIYAIYPVMYFCSGASHCPLVEWMDWGACDPL